VTPGKKRSESDGAVEESSCASTLLILLSRRLACDEAMLLRVRPSSRLLARCSLDDRSLLRVDNDRLEKSHLPSGL
jgi:hypothetical protein